MYGKLNDGNNLNGTLKHTNERKKEHPMNTPANTNTNALPTAAEAEEYLLGQGQLHDEARVEFGAIQQDGWLEVGVLTTDGWVCAGGKVDPDGVWRGKYLV